MVKKIAETDTKINEHLNGLLLRYKDKNTYFKICANKTEKNVRLQLTANPLYWSNIPEEWTKDFLELKRVELDVNKLFTNYIAPEYIVGALGPCLGMKLPLSQTTIFNGLNDEENNFYLITAPIRFLPDFIQFVKKMVNLPPQIKLQMVEKYYRTL